MNNNAGELGGGLYISSSACEIKNKSCVGNNSAIGAAQIWLSTEQDPGLTVYNSKIRLSKGSISSQLWLGAKYQLSGTSAIVCPRGSQLSDTDGKGGLLGCPLCSSNTFNFETEVQNASRSELTRQLASGSYKCKPCPHGSNCSSSLGISAQQGFWVQRNGSDVLSGHCTQGACCSSGECDVGQTCDATHRDNNVRFCGECLDGYSATLGSENCRNTSECNDAPFFFLGAVVAQAAYTAFLLSPLTSSANDGGISMVLFYWQMADSVAADSSALQVVTSSVASFNLLAPSSSSSSFSGICPFKGLQLLDKLLIGYVPPFFTLGTLLLVIMVQKYRCSLDQCYIRSLVATVALCATSIVKPTFDLLACTHMNNGTERTPEMYLLKAASVQCFQWWQYLLIILMLLLLLLVCMSWLFIRQQRSQSATAHGAYVFATAPYHEGFEFWPLYLLAHRVCLVALNTLIVDPIAKALCLFSWCLIVLCAHSAVRPFISTEVGSLQYALLASLVFIAGTSTLEAYKEAAAEDPTPSINTDLKAVQIVQGLVLVWPVFYLVVLTWRKQRHSFAVWCRWVRRKCMQGNNDQRRPAGGSGDSLSSRLLLQSYVNGADGQDCTAEGAQRQQVSATEPRFEVSKLDHEKKEPTSGQQQLLHLESQPQSLPRVEQQRETQELERENRELERENRELQREKQELQHEKRELEREKQELQHQKWELEREKHEEAQSHAGEKKQLEREKRELQREKQELQREKRVYVEAQCHAGEKKQLEREKQ
jgi:hypothetical protein